MNIGNALQRMVEHNLTMQMYEDCVDAECTDMREAGEITGPEWVDAVGVPYITGNTPKKRVEQIRAEAKARVDCYFPLIAGEGEQ